MNQHECENVNLNQHPQPAERASPEQRALGIPIILTEILRNLSTCLLVRYRLVSLTWRDVATSLLVQTRDDIIIRFALTDRGTTYNKYLKGFLDMDKCDVVTIQDVAALIQSSPKFPVVHFQFVDGALGHPALQNFLTVHGKNIKGLRFKEMSFYEFVPDEDSVRLPDEEELPCDDTFMRALLLDQCPHLESLQFDSLPKFPSDIMRLSHLKRVNLDASVDFEFEEKQFENILRLAVNLKVFKLMQVGRCHWGSSCLKQLDVFQNLNRLDLIKNINYHQTIQELDLLDKVSKFPLHLTSIEVMKEHDRDLAKDPRITTALSSILEKTANSLKTLKVNDPGDFGLIPGVIWPVNGCPKVHTLTLQIFNTMNSRRIDDGFKNGLYSFQQVFPNLTTLHITGSEGQQLKLEPSFGKLFTDTEVLPCVTRLQLTKCSKPSLQLVEGLARVCPNVKCLVITHVVRLSKFGRAIWRFKKLTSLILRLHVDGRKGKSFDRTSNTNRFPMIDSIFTGFEERDCVTLNNICEGNGNPWSNERIEAARVHPSILDCSHLQRLDILFYDGVKATRGRGSMTFDLLSKVAAKYAFAHLPDMTVTLSTKRNSNDRCDEMSSSSDSSDLDSDASQNAEDGWSLRLPTNEMYCHQTYVEKFENALIHLASDFRNVHVVDVKTHRASLPRYINAKLFS